MVFNLFSNEPQNKITKSSAGVEHFVIRDLTEAKNRSFEILGELAPIQTKLMERRELFDFEQEKYEQLSNELADLKVFIESEEPAGTGK